MIQKLARKIFNFILIWQVKDEEPPKEEEVPEDEPLAENMGNGSFHAVSQLCYH